MKVKPSIVRNIVNTLGWHTNRKIIVLESDDWGSTRMVSKSSYAYFLKKGYEVDHCAYNKFDALESNKDLECLFDVLTKFKDKYGNPPTFTFNQIVANPDFEKIEQSGYTKYFYEPFTETLKRYPAHDKVFDLYKEGIANQLIQPQFHGREHLNTSSWLEALQQKEESAIEAFKHEMFTVHKSGVSSCKKEHLNAFGATDYNEVMAYQKVLATGMELFKSYWGFNSKTFIAPCYIWPVALEAMLMKLGVDAIQGTHVQRVPEMRSAIIKKKYHYLGQENVHKQKYLVRNAFFEPASNPSINWVDSCLKDIENAFFWHKPAIISTHRVNYIGFIEEGNRDRNLSLLNELLASILKKFPDIEFMTSDQLGKQMMSI